MSRAPDPLDGFGGNLDEAFDAVPDGMVMVPVEPTEAMVVAGALATHPAGFIEDVYRAMIAVAPAVPDSNLVESHLIRTAPAVPKPLAAVNRYCAAGMCLPNDKHEAGCTAHGIAAPGSKP